MKLIGGMKDLVYMEAATGQTLREGSSRQGKTFLALTGKRKVVARVWLWPPAAAATRHDAEGHSRTLGQLPILQGLRQLGIEGHGKAKRSLQRASPREKAPTKGQARRAAGGGSIQKTAKVSRRS